MKKNISLIFTAASFVLIGASPLMASADVFQDIKTICPAYTFTQKEATLATFNPAAKNVGGINFPGNKNTLFRGAYEANPQFSYLSVISGLFGQSNWMIGSPMHWGITEVLTGARTTYDNFLPTGGLPLSMYEYFKARHMEDSIKMLQACASPKFYSKDQANVLAKDLMNKYFNSLTRAGVEENYLNITDPLYYNSAKTTLGFANNAVDLVISSYSDQIAGLYGKKILVFSDRRNRAVDLGFWNFTKNGKFWADWVDDGEINSPGYITAGELIGYQQRLVDRNPIGWGNAPVNNPIDYAFYKMTYNKVELVAVVDGGRELCMVQNSSQQLTYCLDNWSAGLTTAPIGAPVSRGDSYKHRAPLMGVIVKCADSKTCQVPAGFFTWYGKTSTKVLPAGIQNSIDNLTVNGSSLAYIKAAPVAPPVDSQPGVIKVTSATYVTTAEEAAGIKDNVIQSAQSFADGKQTITYKVSSQFLGIKGPRANRKFTLKYSCSNNPTKIVTKTFPAPAEGKVFVMDCSGD